MTLITQAIGFMEEEQYIREVKAVEYFISMCIIRYPFYCTAKDKTVVVKLDLDTVWPKGIVVYWNRNTSISASSLTKSDVCDLLRKAGAQEILCEQISTLNASIVAKF